MISSILLYIMFIHPGQKVGCVGGVDRVVLALMLIPTRSKQNHSKHFFIRPNPNQTTPHSEPNQTRTDELQHTWRSSRSADTHLYHLSHLSPAEVEAAPQTPPAQHEAPLQGLTKRRRRRGNHRWRSCAAWPELDQQTSPTQVNTKSQIWLFRSVKNQKNNRRKAAKEEKERLRSRLLLLDGLEPDPHYY